MEHDVGTAPRTQLDELGGTDVEAMDRELVLAVGARRREIGGASAREVVDHIDRVAAGEQPVDEMRADEAASPGDQSSHAIGSGTRTLFSSPPGTTTTSSPSTTSMSRE